MNFNKTILPLFLITLASGLTFGLDPSSPKAAQIATDSTRTVTVTVWGETIANPSFYTMGATLAGNADTAIEAHENFNQALTRATAAFEDSGLAGLQVKRTGLDFQYTPKKGGNNMNNVVFSGAQAEPNDPGVTCKEKLNIQFEPASEVLARQEQVASALDLALELDLKVKASVVDPYGRNFSSNGSKEAQATGIIAASLSDGARVEAELQAQADALIKAKALATHLAQSNAAALGVVRHVNQNSVKTSWAGIGSGIKVKAQVMVTYVLK